MNPDRWSKEDRRIKFLEAHPNWSYGERQQKKTPADGNYRYQALLLEDRRWKRRRRGTMARLSTGYEHSQK